MSSTAEEDEIRAWKRNLERSGQVDLSEGSGSSSASARAAKKKQLTLISACEDWLSSDFFERDLRKCFEERSRGQGGSERHIAFDLWLQVVKDVHTSLMELPAQPQLAAAFLRGRGRGSTTGTGMGNDGDEGEGGAEDGMWTVEERDLFKSLRLCQMFLPEPDDDFVMDALATLRKGADSASAAAKKEAKDAEAAGGGGLGDDLVPAMECSIPTLLEMQKEGIEDWETCTELTTALYMQLGHCAELMRLQITGMAQMGGKMM